MKTQFENRVMSSLLLFVDHVLLKHGDAYTNHGSYFEEVTQNYTNFYSYGAPFKQFVSDSSISGSPGYSAPSIMSGAHINSGGGWKFFPVGTSGMHSVNYRQGEVNLTTQITGANRISGSYAVKDFNTYLTTLSEEEILFETKYKVRPTTFQTTTGLPPGTQTYPAIFMKGSTSENVPFAFGGSDQTNINVRMVVLADSAFNLDAACSILKDVVKTNVYLIQDELPFDAVGAYTGKAYNYTGIATGDNRVFLNKAMVSKNVGSLSAYNKIHPEMHTAFVDYELIIARFPRKFND